MGNSMATQKYPYYVEKLAEHSAAWRDRYALTMSQAFFSNDRHNTPVTFHAYIRANPFNGAYLLTAGQNIIRDWLADHWRFDARDIELMRNDMVIDKDGNAHRSFTDEFIAMCEKAKMELTIDAMPEGEIAFPDEPIYRVHGPLWQCLMVEAAILNAMNSQSLFATLASRLVDVAGGQPILEFGLRRAQTIGGLEATRAAYIGGVTATSNDLAHKYYGIPAAGTFAHALVMVYEDELDAFKEYASAMPYSGIFLVDTYNSLDGVKKAIKTCQDLKVNLKGIRLDSGDLTYLSKEARKLLNEAGFEKSSIVASNDLDEETISSIKREGGQIDIWGIGTNLVTSKAQPALGGVYKIGAVFNDTMSIEDIDNIRIQIKAGVIPAVNDDIVRNVIKLSEQAVKVTIPGELDVIRFLTMNEGVPKKYNGDTILMNLSFDPLEPNKLSGIFDNNALSRDIISIRKYDESLRKRFLKGCAAYRPLTRMMDKGQMVWPHETIHEARLRAAQSLSLLDPAHKRLRNPHLYVVGLEKDLYETRKNMVFKLRQHNH
jgi:nicotinate phosphoribosyltransferase